MGDLTEHFSNREFQCRCCGESDMNPALVKALEKLRNQLGRPIKITSGYRCPNYNALVGGVPNSEHLQGNAADVVVNGYNPTDIREFAEKIPEFQNGGIGVYPNYIHLDVRSSGRARW